MWLLLYSYGVHCRAVVFIPVLWYSPCSGVHCSSVVFITVLWCSLLCCGIRCRAVVFITVMWCSCRVHYCIVAFIAVLLCSAPYCGAVLRFSFHCYGVQNTAEFSVDIIGQRYARKETGQRNGHHYSIFYLYYYAAVCSVLVLFSAGVRRIRGQNMRVLLFCSVVSTLKPIVDYYAQFSVCRLPIIRSLCKYDVCVCLSA